MLCTYILYIIYLFTLMVKRVTFISINKINDFICAINMEFKNIYIPNQINLFYLINSRSISQITSIRSIIYYIL